MQVFTAFELFSASQTEQISMVQPLEAQTSPVKMLIHQDPERVSFRSLLRCETFVDVDAKFGVQELHAQLAVSDCLSVVRNPRKLPFA